MAGVTLGIGNANVAAGDADGTVDDSLGAGETVDVADGVTLAVSIGVAVGVGGGGMMFSQ